MVKVQAVKAEVHQVMEKLVAVAAARCRAVLATAETVVEVGTEQGGGLPLKQKMGAEGKQLVCDCCATRGFNCQVNWSKMFCSCPSTKDG